MVKPNPGVAVGESTEVKLSICLWLWKCYHQLTRKLSEEKDLLNLENEHR